jgi:hypothetical protein
VDTAFVSDWVSLEGTVQPSLQVEELLWSEEICRKNPQVAEAARAVGVEPENLYVDGEWFVISPLLPFLTGCFTQDGVSVSMNVSRIDDSSSASFSPD